MGADGLKAYFAKLEMQQPATATAAFSMVAGHHVVVALFPDETESDGRGYRVLKGLEALSGVRTLESLRQLRIGAIGFRSAEEAQIFARLHAATLLR